MYILVSDLLRRAKVLPEFFRNAERFWRQVLNREEASSLPGLVAVLEGALLNESERCGGNFLGLEILVVVGIGRLQEEDVVLPRWQTPAEVTALQEHVYLALRATRIENVSELAVSARAVLDPDWLLATVGARADDPRPGVAGAAGRARNLTHELIHEVAKGD